MSAKKAAKKNTARKAKPALSRAKILTKAIRLADSNGLDALSMRKLAQSLQVEAMSLYNHVHNKDDVIDGMINSVVEQFVVPDVNKPWKQSMRTSAISTHKTLLNHPWAANLMITRVIMGEGMMTYSEACYGCLANAGFSYAMTDHAWNAISNHIYGFTLTQISSPLESSEYANAAEQYLPQVPKQTYPHIHAMMQLIIKGEHSGVNNFEFGLDLILDGLERKLQNQ